MWTLVDSSVFAAPSVGHHGCSPPWPQGQDRWADQQARAEWHQRDGDDVQHRQGAVCRPLESTGDMILLKPTNLTEISGSMPGSMAGSRSSGKQAADASSEAASRSRLNDFLNLGDRWTIAAVSDVSSSSTASASQMLNGWVVQKRQSGHDQIVLRYDFAADSSVAHRGFISFRVGMASGNPQVVYRMWACQAGGSFQVVDMHTFKCINSSRGSKENFTNLRDWLTCPDRDAQHAFRRLYSPPNSAHQGDGVVYRWTYSFVFRPGDQLMISDLLVEGDPKSLRCPGQAVQFTFRRADFGDMGDALLDLCELLPDRDKCALKCVSRSVLAECRRLRPPVRTTNVSRLLRAETVEWSPRRCELSSPADCSTLAAAWQADIGRLASLDYLNIMGYAIAGLDLRPIYAALGQGAAPRVTTMVANYNSASSAAERASREVAARSEAESARREAETEKLSALREEETNRAQQLASDQSRRRAESELRAVKLELIKAREELDSLFSAKEERLRAQRKQEAEEKRLAAEEEERRLAMEAAKREEERRLAAEAAKREAEEKRRAAEAAKREKAEREAELERARKAEEKAELTARKKVEQEAAKAERREKIRVRAQAKEEKEAEETARLALRQRELELELESTRRELELESTRRDEQERLSRELIERLENGSGEQQADARERLHVEAQDGKKECIVCMANPISHALSPCGHYALCGDCVNELKLNENGNNRPCPVCQQKVNKVIKIYGGD